MPVLAALLLLLSADATVRVTPPPAWVEETPLAFDAPVPTEDVAGGFHELLVETQQRAGDGAPVTYHRRAWRVLSPAGVEVGSEVRFSFVPDYEKASLHHVRVWRDGRDVSAFRPADVKVVHDEPGLSGHTWDEGRKAVVFLRDVRPGDVVDYAYSTEGGNPVFGSHIGVGVGMALDMPVHTLRYRLLWTATRPLFIRDHGTVPRPTITDTPDGRRYEWLARSTRPVSSEDDLPPGVDSEPWVQVSDFASWHDVAAWASDLFTVPEGPSPTIDAVVDRLRRLPSEPERVVGAVRFAQDDVRYLGLEIGANSHRPHSPEETARQRYGDCKDKALLLTVLLRRLGVTAVPALVSTSSRRGLDQWQPSALAFDHAVVKARLGNRDLWIDATRSGQGGGLEALATLPWERALPVQPDATLVPVPGDAPTAHAELVEETYSVPSYGAPVRLTVTTTWRGRAADQMRASLDDERRTETARRYREFYAHDDPDLKVVKAATVDDERSRGELVVKEEYELPSFWDGDERELTTWLIADAPARPKGKRRQPLSIDHPQHLEHRIVVDLPEALDLPVRAEAVSGPTFKVDVRTRREGRRFVMEARYDSTSDVLQPADVAAQVKAADRVSGVVSRTITHAPGVPRVSEASRADPSAAPGAAAAAESAPPPAVDGGPWVQATLGVVIAGAAAVAVVGMVRRRRRQRQFAVLQFVRPGDAPHTAIALEDEPAVERWLATRACACGAFLPAQGERHAGVYDGQRIVSVDRTCDRCRRTQHLYYRLG